jgi:hypothetical protein
MCRFSISMSVMFQSALFQKVTSLMHGLCVVSPWPLCFLSGCIFVPVIESVRELGFTKDQRSEQLPKVLKTFNDDVYWSKSSELQAMFDRDLSKESRSALLRPKKNLKTVSTDIDVTDINPDATEARVEVTRKRYSLDTLIVEECPEAQLWIFRSGKGWRLNEVTTRPCGPTAAQ